MNDRFKFRVWNKENNKYEDDLYYEAGDLQVACVNKIFEEYISDGCIIEQCTGLKDMNGKLIYEGDIVIKSDVSAIGYSRTRVCKVHWHNDWLSWAITTQYGDTYELSEFESQQYEIIGNIHENADLRKVGGK